jgi:hypothetical protein
MADDLLIDTAYSPPLFEAVPPPDLAAEAIFDDVKVSRVEEQGIAIGEEITATNTTVEPINNWTRESASTDTLFASQLPLNAAQASGDSARETSPTTELSDDALPMTTVAPNSNVPQLPLQEPPTTTKAVLGASAIADINNTKDLNAAANAAADAALEATATVTATPQGAGLALARANLSERTDVISTENVNSPVSREIPTTKLASAQVNGATDFNSNEFFRMAAVGVGLPDVGKTNPLISAVPKDLAEPTDPELGVARVAVKEFLGNAGGQADATLSNPVAMESKTPGSSLPRSLGLNSNGSYASAEIRQNVAATNNGGTPASPQEAYTLAGAPSTPSNGVIRDPVALVNNVPLRSVQSTNIDGSWIGIPRERNQSNPATATNSPNESHAYDPGKMAYTDVPAYEPKGDVQNKGSRTIFINGQNTLPTVSAVRAQQLADATGRPVVGLYNQTKGERYSDFEDSYLMKTNSTTDKDSIGVLARSVIASAKADSSLTIVAHSQGGLVTQVALARAKQELTRHYGSADAAEIALKKTFVETHGSPSNESTPFPSGPNYVHFINRSDAVPTAMRGITPAADKYNGYGKGAVVIDFDTRNGPDQVAAHTLPTYLKERGSETTESIYKRNSRPDGSVNSFSKDLRPGPGATFGVPYP